MRPIRQGAECIFSTLPAVCCRSSPSGMLWRRANATAAIDHDLSRFPFHLVARHVALSKDPAFECLTTRISIALCWRGIFCVVTMVNGIVAHGGTAREKTEGIICSPRYASLPADVQAALHRLEGFSDLVAAVRRNRFSHLRLLIWREYNIRGEAIVNRLREFPSRSCMQALAVAAPTRHQTSPTAAGARKNTNRRKASIWIYGPRRWPSPRRTPP